MKNPELLNLLKKLLREGLDKTSVTQLYSSTKIVDEESGRKAITSLFQLDYTPEREFTSAVEKQREINAALCNLAFCIPNLRELSNEVIMTRYAGTDYSALIILYYEIQQ